MTRQMKADSGLRQRVQQRHNLAAGHSEGGGDAVGGKAGGDAVGNARGGRWGHGRTLCDVNCEVWGGHPMVRPLTGPAGDQG